VPALVARAEWRLGGSEVVKVTADLDAAERAAAKEADIRLRIGLDYERVDMLPQAVSQLDVWIAEHPNDSRIAAALNERCWSRSLVGQDLRKALDDCNAALKRIDKTNGAAAPALTGRGLVRLRLGDYDKSITDFNAALGIDPKDAWALYGRGIDKLRRGNAGQGEADMAAATTLWPPTADHLKKYGITR